MKQEFNLCRTELENLIDEWIFNEEDRAMLKRRLLDGVVYEKIAEEYNFSVQHTFNRIHRAKELLFKHIK